MSLYKCPSCNGISTSLFHNCPFHNGISVTGLAVKDEDERPDGVHRRVMREDYVGVDGPLAAVLTVRPDGSNDATVLAMPARLDLRAGAGHVGVGIAAHVAAARGGSESPAYRRHNWRDPELERMARLAARYDLRMAWSASAPFAFAMLGLAQKAGLNLASDAFKAAVYSSNTMTPDKTVTTAALTSYAGTGSQWVTGNENSGAGYTAGGSGLTSVSLAQASNVVTFSAANITWSSATVTGYGDLVYDTTASNAGLCFNYFGGVQSVTTGTFTLSWPSGIFTITS